MEIDIDTIREIALLWSGNIFFAILIFFIGKWAAKRISRVCKTIMRKSRMDETLIGFFGHVINAAVLGFVIIAALNKLGIETTSLAAVVAAAGLAIGLSLQGSLSNLAAGIMIIIFRPFRVGDYVEAGGTNGLVEEISIFTTNFTTPDNKHVIVPNNEITSGVITNYSAKPVRRIDLVIGVSYDDDLKKTREIIKQVIESDNTILEEPAVQIAVSELAESSVNFVVRPWVKTENYWSTRFDLIENIKIALDNAGITIPYPQRDLHIIDGDKVQKNTDKTSQSKNKKTKTKTTTTKKGK